MINQKIYKKETTGRANNVSFARGGVGSVDSDRAFLPSPTQNRNGGSGAVIAAEMLCFASGTHIRTANGDAAVESLNVGDLVLTSIGEKRAITWTGHRTIDCASHPHPEAIWPIRIAAAAIGDNQPDRDLYVSPGHALCVDVLGEVFIAASVLVNGATIAQVEVDAVTYWHVELDSQDVIIANNQPVESDIDAGNRAFFSEGEDVDLETSAPDASPAARRIDGDFCRPVHLEGRLVDVVRDRLHAHAEALGWTLKEDADVHLIVDGVRIDPNLRKMAARFFIPPGAKEIWLAAETSRPRDVGLNNDTRRLGVCIGALTIIDGFGVSRKIDLDDERLSIGFFALEEGPKRWISDRAQLPAELWLDFPDGAFLCVDFALPGVPRWVAQSGSAPHASQEVATA